MHLFRILLIVLALAPARARAASTELDHIPLFQTSDYDPRDERGRGFKAFFTGLGVAIAGPGKDLKKQILTKLNTPELRTYFPTAGERERLADQISDGMYDRFLQHGYTNKNVVKATRYATSEIIVMVLQRVLAKEGQADPKRAGLWSRKILIPYHHCMIDSRTYKEGEKCGTALEADLVKNMGLAMTYEITRQKFGPAYAKARPREFAACVRENQRGANDRVKDCALKGVKSAAKEFGRARILEAAKKEVPHAVAVRIANAVMPGFERCLDETTERAGLEKCGDRVIGAAGAELAHEAILADKRVQLHFQGEELKSLAGKARDAFARCMASNEKNNRRDPNGTLTTANCETFVKMETARSVSIEALKKTLEKNMPDNAEARAAALKSATNVLGRCWNSHKPEAANAPCLRSTAKNLAVSVARDKLTRELPPDVQEKDPAFRERLLATFDGCLEKRLPANLFIATNADAVADTCAKTLYREGAIQVAEVKVRAALGKVSDQLTSEDAMEPLVEVFVKQAFAKCLGEAPDAARLDVCSLKLQKNVAFSIAEGLLPFKVDEFFRQGGGLEAYELTLEDRRALLKAVIGRHKQCLKTEVKSLKSEESEKEVNECFKGTIRDLSLRMAPLELERMAKANGVAVKEDEFKKLREEFSADFAACLDEKKDADVNEYLKGLEACQARITKAYTVKIAKAELTKQIRTVYPTAADADKVQKIEEDLFRAFDKCMSKATNGKAREECVLKLKADATVTLSRVGVSQRAEAALGEVPETIKALEAKLDECLGTDAKKEVCATDYVRSASITLGKETLQKTAREELGPLYESASARITPLEKGFATCMNAIGGTLDKAFLLAAGECETKLGTDSINVLIDAKEALTPAKPEPEKRKIAGEEVSEVSEAGLADMISRTFLCLNGQLTPDTASSLANIDPESVEAELLKLIGGFVSYDLKQAKDKYESVLTQVSEDLKAAGPEQARRRLLGELVKGGMADQLLKSMIRTEIEKAVKSLPADRRPSSELEKSLLDRGTLDRLLDAQLMDKARPLLTAGVLEPVLLEGQTLRSSAVLRSLRSVREIGVQALLVDPAFESLKGSLK